MEVYVSEASSHTHKIMRGGRGKVLSLSGRKIVKEKKRRSAPPHNAKSLIFRFGLYSVEFSLLYREPNKVCVPASCPASGLQPGDA